MKIEINEELRSFIPPLADAERDALEASIVESQGAVDPLTVYRPDGSLEDCVLLDGHHRYEICTRLSLHYFTREVDVRGLSEAKRWMFAHQIGRRNLSPDQVIALAVLHELAIPKKLRGRSRTRAQAERLAATDAGREALAEVVRGVVTSIAVAANQSLCRGTPPPRRSRRAVLLDSIRGLSRAELEEVAQAIVAMLEEAE